MNDVCIYGLREEGGEEIRYVGQTMNPSTRFNQHLALRAIAESNPKRQWLEECLQGNIKVEMVILERCDKLQSDEKEQAWINHHRSLGCRLTNTVMTVASTRIGSTSSPTIQIYMGGRGEKERLVGNLTMVAKALRIETAGLLIRWLGEQPIDDVIEALRPIRINCLDRQIKSLNIEQAPQDDAAA